MTPSHRKRSLAASLLVSSAGPALAAPATYEIDPAHTYPSFSADHMGISKWRGKFNRSSGKMILDKAAGTGSVEVEIDVASVDFGLEAMQPHALGPDFFDVENYPKATYRGTLEGFEGGAPTRVVGELTMHGMTRPVQFTINSFKCIPHPMHKRELCGADAEASIDREQFGLTAGKDYGFSMQVLLQLQFEAVRAQ